MALNSYKFTIIITTYGYDSTGRPVRTTDAAGGTVTCTYDSDGRMTTVTDAMGGVKSYAYDAAGRVTKETGAIGNENSYAYNTVGLSLTRRVQSWNGMCTVLTGRSREATPQGQRICITA